MNINPYFVTLPLRETPFGDRECLVADCIHLNKLTDMIGHTRREAVRVPFLDDFLTGNAPREASLQSL